jgi:hypothetical protein
MPGLRVEIAERFVLHLVELGEQLGDQAVGTAVVGEEIVADAVTSWTPKNLVAMGCGLRVRRELGS